MTHPSLVMMGDKHMTIGVDDVKTTFDGEVFGAREERDGA